jgi:hypothetical protein
VAWAIPNYTATTTAGSMVWTQWIQEQPITSSYIQTATITATNSTNVVWDQWRNVGYSTQVLTWQDEVWNAWEQDDDARAEMQRQRDELQARREQQSREALAREQERQELYLVAHARALELLHEVVAEEDRVPGLDQLIQLRGSDGNLYRIETHRETVHGNIVEVDEHGCMLGRACVAPGMYDREGGGALPTADGWVGQYLGLKFDAAEFLLQANWSGRRGCQQREAA